MTTTVERLIKIAKAEVGYHEGRSGSHWNNKEKYAAQVPSLTWADGQPWCDVFVAWIFTHGHEAHLIPISASCDTSRAAWKQRKRWSEYPAIGAQVIYGTTADAQHTGFVIDYDDTWIWTVEGNTNDNGSAEGDGVYLKKRLRRDDWVQGYGLPEYPEGIQSADPKFARQRPKPKRPSNTPGPNVVAAQKAVDKGAAYAKKHHDTARLRWWQRLAKILKGA